MDTTGTTTTFPSNRVDKEAEETDPRNENDEKKKQNTRTKLRREYSTNAHTHTVCVLGAFVSVFKCAVFNCVAASLIISFTTTKTAAAAPQIQIPFEIEKRLKKWCAHTKAHFNIYCYH